MFDIKIAHVTTPPGKCADVEIHFTHTLGEEAALQHETSPTADALLSGLKLIGFAVWQQRSTANYNVTYPARQYSVNGERRSFALLRPIALAGLGSQERLREAIIQAYINHPDTPTATKELFHARTESRS